MQSPTEIHFEGSVFVATHRMAVATGHNYLNYLVAGSACRFISSGNRKEGARRTRSSLRRVVRAHPEGNSGVRSSKYCDSALAHMFWVDWSVSTMTWDCEVKCGALMMNAA